LKKLKKHEYIFFSSQNERKQRKQKQSLANIRFGTKTPDISLKTPDISLKTPDLMLKHQK